MNIEMVKGYKESGPGPSKEPSYKIPQFPWPPPKPSAFADIPPRFLLKPDVQTLLKDVAERLKMAFEQAGYGEKSWYQCPDGFALVSRLEQIYSDGSPKEGEVRWIPNVDNLPIFSLGSYLKALFTAPKGHYRVIVFVVTDKIFGPSPQVVSPEEAQAWLSTGSMELPPEIGVQPYTKNHYCKALIYEFEQSNHKPIPKIPSDLQGEDHLKKARLWSALGGLDMNIKSERISMVESKKRLATIWFIGAAALFLLVFAQHMGGKYGKNTGDAWSWLLPNCLPTLSLIIGVLVKDSSKKISDTTADRFLFRLSCGLSICYLLINILVILLNPGNPLGMMNQSKLFLGPLQGLVSAALGAFFITKK